MTNETVNQAIGFSILMWLSIITMNISPQPLAWLYLIPMFGYMWLMWLTYKWD